LEGVRVGGRWLTSEGALRRFIAAQQPPAPDDDRSSSKRTPQQSRLAGERACAQLEQRGI
jgi:hypothetical protein